ncbi:malate synthase A [Fluviicola taffensis]|uniref:malate synthase A n=1 Tax=Fluviicola taffensis TaxID=191579 RepID=UPI0031377369
METKRLKKMIEVSHEQTFPEILTNDALIFLFALHEQFDTRRLKLLENRAAQQVIFNSGELPVFPKETTHIRESDWVAAPIPADLQDRRVEITGPVDRKMIINALNSGASVFMADFEDATSPTWNNLMEGQQNLKDAIQQTISWSQNGKSYSLNEKVAVLKVRPRGLHLSENNLRFQQGLAAGSLVDFGLFFFHNYHELITRGTAPYFYLPKLEHYEEARWWNDVFVFAQAYFGIPKGSIKATVLIETITASFQLDEIIYELRDHITGLNCGRWDYIFSFIKKLNKTVGFAIPDRDQVTMTSPFMAAYSQLVIQRCHRRNIHAIGGMAAQIPIKNDSTANEISLNKVRTDKEREVKNGHDGTWVAHPALVPLAKEIFDREMTTPNQISLKLDKLFISERDLLQIPQGTITEAGIRKNINVGILYLESWLMGTGAAALYHLMEDTATAEISRAQLWLWLKKNVSLETGELCTQGLYLVYIAEELRKIVDYVGQERYNQGKFELATELFKQLIFNEELDDFLTLKAYEYIYKN